MCRRLRCLLLLLCLIPISAQNDCESSLRETQSERQRLKEKLDAERTRAERLESSLKQMEQEMTMLDDDIKGSRGREAKALQKIKELKDTVGQLEKDKIGCGDACLKEVNKVEASMEDVRTQLEESKTAKAACDKELTIGESAQKQLEVELTNAFTRIQVMGSEIKQLNRYSKELKGQLKNKDAALVEALDRADAAEEAAEKLQSHSGFRISIDAIADWIVVQMEKLSVFWLAFARAVQPLTDIVMTWPYIPEAVEVTVDVTVTAKEWVKTVLDDAASYAVGIYVSCEQYGHRTVEGINKTYDGVRPAIDRTVQSIQVFVSQTVSSVKGGYIRSVVVIKAWSATAYESEFAKGMRKLSDETLRELQDYIQNQMGQIPSLQPFAKREYATMVVWTMMSLPLVFAVGLLMACLGSGTKKPVQPTVQPERSGKKTKRGGKGKKGKVIREGEDSVKFG